MKNLSAFQKQQIAQMTGLNREQVDEVLEAIRYVKAKTPAFTGPPGGPHSATQWTETRMSGRRKREANMRSGRSVANRGPKVVKLEP